MWTTRLSQQGLHSNTKNGLLIAYLAQATQHIPIHQVSSNGCHFSVSMYFSVSGLCPCDTYYFYQCSKFPATVSISLVSLLFSVSGLCLCNTYYFYQCSKFPATVAISLMFLLFSVSGLCLYNTYYFYQCSKFPATVAISLMFLCCFQWVVCVRTTLITSTNAPSFLQRLPFLLCFFFVFSEWSVSVQHLLPLPMLEVFCNGCHFSYVSLLFAVSGLCPCNNYYFYQCSKFPATVAISLMFLCVFQWLVCVRTTLITSTNAPSF